MYNVFVKNSPTQPNENKKLKILLLGTCGAEAFIDTQGLYELELNAQHLLYDGLTPIKLPSAQENYDAVIVVLTERYIVDCAGNKGNEFLLHRDGIQRETILQNAKDDISRQFNDLTDNFTTTQILFLSFSEPSVNLNGLLSHRYSLTNPKHFVHLLNEYLSTICDTKPNTYFLDINLIAASLGALFINDQLLNSTFHGNYLSNWDYANDNNRIVKQSPMSDLVNFEDRVLYFKHTFWCTVIDAITIIRSPLPIKAIIIDLDDTLWRGVAADDALTPTDRVEGWPLGFAEALLYYKNRGGLLAIASKNDRTIAHQKLVEIYGDKITINDFASTRIGWERKSDYVAEILQELNLLPDNVAFIDDNPREVNDVKERFPGIHTLGFEPYLWRAQIIFGTKFQVAKVSNEAKERTQLLHASISRRNLAKSMPREEWLKSLELAVHIRVILSHNDIDFSRALELLNKTNQFNTTGRRWDFKQLQDLFESGGRIYTVRAKDKLADNGIISVAIVYRANIEQMVLSCRVFGLGIEDALLSNIESDILAQSDEVCAKLIDTGRNFTCHGTFKDRGYVQRTADSWFRSNCGEPPEWITLTVDLI